MEAKQLPRLSMDFHFPGILQAPIVHPSVPRDGTKPKSLIEEFVGLSKWLRDMVRDWGKGLDENGAEHAPLQVPPPLITGGL